ALQQIRLVRFSNWIGKILECVRMRVDESRRDDHAGCINDARGHEISFPRVANKDDSIAANANIRVPGFASGTVNQLSMEDENIELIGLSCCDNAARRHIPDHSGHEKHCRNTE